MSGVGGVGGAGSTAGMAGVGGAGSTAGTGNAEVTASDSDSIGSKSTSEDNVLHEAAQPMCSLGHNMSTQSFVELHNTAITQVNEAQSADIDLKKLIEMMIAIELLKALDEQ